MDKERFTLLLLEPGEIYFEDFSVNLLNAKSIIESYDGDELMGRLKMCSKSIVFEPKNSMSVPLLKINFKDCNEIFSRDLELFVKNVPNVLGIECSQYTEMLENNIVAPYTFKNTKTTFHFELHYANVDDYIGQLRQLHRASSLFAYEQNSMIATIVYSRHNRVKFDPLWLDDIFEKKVVDFPVNEINPLVVNPGRLLLTSTSLYYQPYNNIHNYPVKKIKLKSITSLIKRRFLLRHIGLEIKSKVNGAEQILYTSFNNADERDEFYSHIVQQEDYNIELDEQESMTVKWQNGLISNFDYLIYLNSLADRTFQDLTQYPVFPWILTDYTSSEIDLSNLSIYRDLTKPIGALNDERFAKLMERYLEMDDPKFIYGSHYSAPGLVLFFLVRKYPNLMLCLQNGKFDHPDRMFHRMEDAFKNCLLNMSDFKELIPEFYDTNQKGDFLLNSQKINFSTRHDGTPVNHVILPPWARNSPELFVNTLRQALESDYVSQNLNHWIDLIFGYKQRGEEAIKAKNLFYYLCYEGSVDLDNISDLAKKHALEVQISEFGQIAKQLFKKPHVSKILHTDKQPIDLQEERSKILENSKICINIDTIFNSHKDDINCIINYQDNNIISISNDGSFKCYNLISNKQLRNVSISDMALSSCIAIPSTSNLIFSSWNNTIITYTMSYGCISLTLEAHEDAVSCLSLIDNDLLISGSWDCSIKVWKLNSSQSSRDNCNSSIDYIGYLSMDDKILCLDSRITANKVLNIIIGLSTGEIFLWKISHSQIMNNQQHLEFESKDLKHLVTHTGGVTDLKFDKCGSKVVSSGSDMFIYVIDIDTGMILSKKSFTNPILCLEWAKDDNYLLLGDSMGKFLVWNMLNDKICFEYPAYNGSLQCLTLTQSRKLITGGKDSNDYLIKIWNINI